VFDGSFLALTLLLCAALVAIALTRLLLWQKLALAGLLQALFIFNLLTPAVAELQQAPVKEAAAVARKLDADFIAYGIHMPSFSVYRQAITPRRDPAPGDHLFTRSDRLPALFERFGDGAIDIFYRKGGIVLARIAPDTGLPGERDHAGNQ
jgi:hypothetical protein